MKVVTKLCRPFKNPIAVKSRKSTEINGRPFPPRQRVILPPEQHRADVDEIMMRRIDCQRTVINFPINIVVIDDGAVVG